MIFIIKNSQAAWDLIFRRCTQGIHEDMKYPEEKIFESNKNPHPGTFFLFKYKIRNSEFINMKQILRSSAI